MANRRETLKIIGAIGTTCAFPFSADELYGQHVHPPPKASPSPLHFYAPKFFTLREMETLSRLADVIIPPTATPGASQAGVPQYIDEVVCANRRHQDPFRKGLRWLDSASHKRYGMEFHQLSETAQIELLTPLSNAIDRGRPRTSQEKFFHLAKSLTSDGYYTSHAGLVEELGYNGNSVLERFPDCTHEH